MIRSYLSNYAHKNVSRWMVLCIDVFLVVQTFFIAYFIRFNFSVDFDVYRLFYDIPVIAILAFVSFFLIGSYKGVIRQTGLRDALNVYIGVSLFACLLALIVLLNKWFNFRPYFTVPIVIIVIHYLLNIIFLITSRFVFKFIYRKIASDLKKPAHVLIYGAGEMGSIVYSTLSKDLESSHKIIGFIDDDVNKSGKKINRLPIFDSTEITDVFVEDNKIEEIIIAIQKIRPERLLEIVDEMYSLNVQVKIAPPVSKWVDGDLHIGQVKQIKIEDLLERSPINLDNPILDQEFKGKTVFITGAAGSIGSEISRQISGYPCEKLVLIDQAESSLYDLEQELKRERVSNYEVYVSDVRDLYRMDQLFSKYKPDIVFHAAAYKHVPLMEDSPYEAVKINVNGTKNIADLALKYEADKFVMVSTDKAVNPTNVMGATKRVAEMYINCKQKEGEGKTKYITTRFGNVLGSNGSVIPLFKKQIEEGGPLTLTHKEITRFFMTIPEACQLVIEAGTMGEGGEIFIFDMGESVKIYDLAVKMIQLSGLKYPDDIDIKITGLRPGEKLYEELLNDGENTMPTHHEKIMISKVRELDCVKIVAGIENLCKNNSRIEDAELVRFLKGIVPEYISENSVFENLDEKNNQVTNNWI
ncbi:polysaccharide biosynthesis protein [Flavicella sediminum]|uniref:polysaccharide biosynthesis protein n=1 Tax=Flavicella sediminum TaxID=2585141 RepID=UPI001120A218|nr:nucleoside-diphosphate sugar epimerase/dehydratase [Flavicella sediminum]